MSKAFDTVNHPLLLSKLSKLGIASSALSWFQSYISDRTQVTSLSGSTSSPGFPTSGVPQGSVLGPTLFSAFINDLPKVLPDDSTLLFADDTTIFISGKDPQLLNHSLQSCLDLANNWMKDNGFILNVKKSKCMLIHSPRTKGTTPLLHIHLGGQKLTRFPLSSFLASTLMIL